MTRRVKTALVSAGIFLGCLVAALAVQVAAAERQALRQRVEVTSVHELGDGRLLVSLAPDPAASETVAVEAITRYPFGLAVVEPGGDGTPLRPASRPVAVRTTTLRPGPVHRTVVAFGTVHAKRDAAVTAEVAGRVIAVHAPLGAQVAPGAALVELDPRERQVALRRAEAELARARGALRRGRAELASLSEQLRIAADTLVTRERERERWTDLAAQEVASPQRADQAAEAWRAARATAVRLTGGEAVARAAIAEAEAAQALAEAARDQAALQLERCTLRAPFAGEVAGRRVDVGDWVAVGAPAVRLVDREALRVRVHVREDEAVTLRPGARAALTFPGLDLPAPPDGARAASDGA